MKCRECGSELDNSKEQLKTAVDPVLKTSSKDAKQVRDICPLCGHSKRIRFWHRKTVLFLVIAAWTIFLLSLSIHLQRSEQRKVAAVAEDAVARIGKNAEITRLLGRPVTMEPGVKQEIEQGKTGWTQLRLKIFIRGPYGRATAEVVAGRGVGPWVFTVLKVNIEKQQKQIDLVAAPRRDGKFACVFASVDARAIAPQLGKCDIAAGQTDPVDRFEADLRYGRFVLRETDLYLDDIFKVPLTRSYTSAEWLHPNHVHAFGRNSNHPYDIAPVGSRFPYTYHYIILEDGDFLYFPRISSGTGYADAVFQHTETSTRFYRATQRWNGNGWTTRLVDGSEIVFPDSSNAKTMAQGAPIEMRDAAGNRLELRRDGQRNLLEITTPHGHWIRFNYDHLSRITLAEDDAGHWAKYEYNADGMLMSAILWSGRERHYEYDGVLMTQVIDEGGRVLLRNLYQSGILQRQEFGDGAVCSYRYQWARKRYELDRVWVTLPDQSTKELTWDSFRNIGK